MIRIDRLEAEERYLVIHWADGHRSRFHHAWLRDNCSCNACGNKSGGHRYLALNDIARGLTPSAIEIDSHGKLVLTWAGDGHRTRYAPHWLRTHCYSPEARAARGRRHRLWDGGMAEGVTKWSYPRVRANEATRQAMFEALRDEGFVLLGEVPAELDFFGALKAVRLNERTMAPLEVGEDEMEATYAALQELFALIYDPGNWLQIRLEAGDAVVLDNHRVLHARTAFEGHRHLRQCHVDRDEFFSRLRALRRRTDPDSEEWARTEFVPSTA